MGRPSRKSEMEGAALELFAEHGVQGTSVRDIAERAGVTEGALYRHFESKDALAQTLFEACAAEFTGILDEAAQTVEDGTARARLTAVVRAFFRYAQAHTAEYQYIMARHYGDLPKMDPLARKPKDAFVDIVRDGTGSGEFREVDPELGAAMVIGMCVRSEFFKDMGLIEAPLGEIAEEVARAAVAALAREQRTAAELSQQWRGAAREERSNGGTQDCPD